MTNNWLLLLLLGTILSCSQKNDSNLDFVDPSIGGIGVILEPTRPTVHLPNSMVRVFPMRKDHLDDQIGNFQLTNTSHRLYSVFALMPVSGTVNSEIWSKRYVYGPEVQSPYYYKTTFENSGTSLEFSPQARSGYFRFQFIDNEEHYLRMGLFNDVGEIDTLGRRAIAGTEVFAGVTAYFYAEIDADIAEIKYQNSADKKKLLIAIGNKAQMLSFRYGVS